MKISIVTISYNQAQFLERAICSVIEQDYNDLEYIVVDPGSTDGSREIIEKYRDQIAHMIFEPDAGPADGLNRGFSLATGDVYGFLNSDDELLPNAIDEAMNYLSVHSNIDVVSGHSWAVDESGICIRRIYSDQFDLSRVAYGACVIMQPSTFFRASAFQNTLGFNINNISNWDGELFIDMALNNQSFGVVNRFWSKYRLHDEGITGSGKLQKQIKRYKRNQFLRIVGREEKSVDKYIRIYYLILKYCLSPTAALERILKGPVTGIFRK